MKNEIRKIIKEALDEAIECVLEDFTHLLQTSYPEGFKNTLMF